MTEFIEMKTSALTGEALNWAVAKARGIPVGLVRGGSYGQPNSLWFVALVQHGERFNPAVDGNYALSLQREFLLEVGFDGAEGGNWCVTSAICGQDPFQVAPVDSLPLAIYRAAVEIAEGDTVLVPAELVAA